MSDLTSSATTEGASGVAGGMPAESDLPAMQGLDEATDDPSDPQAAGQDHAASPEQRLDDLDQGVDQQAASDPMPDAAGSSGA